MTYFEIHSLFVLALDMLWGTKSGINEKSIPSERKHKKGIKKGKHERFVVVYQGRVGLLSLLVSNLNKYFQVVSMGGKKKNKKMKYFHIRLEKHLLISRKLHLFKKI